MQTTDQYDQAYWLSGEKLSWPSAAGAMQLSAACGLAKPAKPMQKSSFALCFNIKGQDDPTC